MKYKLYIGRYIFVKADRMSLSKINVYMAAYNLKSVLDDLDIKFLYFINDKFVELYGDTNFCFSLWQSSYKSYLTITIRPNFEFVYLSLP